MNPYETTKFNLFQVDNSILVTSSWFLSGKVKYIKFCRRGVKDCADRSMAAAVLPSPAKRGRETFSDSLRKSNHPLLKKCKGCIGDTGISTQIP